MKVNPMLMIDGYKADHRSQYPKGTEYVYSNFTPRQSRISGIDFVIFFGLQYYLMEYLIRQWNENFFKRNKDEVLYEYKRRMDAYLGPNAINVDHVAELHDLGYLPLRVKALPEGYMVPMGVPVLTIENTRPEQFWLTNHLETNLSNILWKPITSATTAFQYRRVFERFARKTGYAKEFVQWQGHDFSNRGMSGLEDAMISGAGHLTSFTGTDTVPAIEFIENYYTPVHKDYLIGGSVPATEHSVMSMGGNDNELETFRRLITEVYPNGIVSIVSDTWDFWRVMTEYMPALKAEICARNGRVVIRPDSGDPADIICGVRDDRDHNNALYTEAQYKGAYQILWEIFGGHYNKEGYKVLNPAVGLIYGDSITMERQVDILQRLEAKGFCASNLVLGIGSYTYEYVTRDTYGFAMKATWGQVNGEGRPIFKNPKTDTGFKKSARGLLAVHTDSFGKLYLKDNCTRAEENNGLLATKFLNGRLTEMTDIEQIRERVLSNIKS